MFDRAAVAVTVLVELILGDTVRAFEAIGS